MATGKETRSFVVDSNLKESLPDVRGLTFINGNYLITWGATHTIKVWDIENAKLNRIFMEDATSSIDKKNFISQVTVSPDGATLAFIMSYWPWAYAAMSNWPWAYAQATLNVWNLKDGKSRCEISVPADHYTSPVFSPDSRHIAWLEPGGAIHVYQSGSLEKTRSFGKSFLGGSAEALSFSPDGKILAVLTASQTIRILDSLTGKRLRQIGEALPPKELTNPRRRTFDDWTPSCGPVRLAWSPNSKLIAQGWRPAMVRIWDAETGKGNDAPIANYGPNLGLIVAADGKSAVTMGADNSVRTWDVTTATEKRRVFLPPKMVAHTLLDTGRALMGTKAESLSIWDINKSKELLKIRHIEDREQISRFDLTNDGKSLLAVNYAPGSFSSRLSDWYPTHSRLYDVKTGAARQAFVPNWIKRGPDKRDEAESAIWVNTYPVAIAYGSKGSTAVATIVSPSFGFGAGSYDHYALRYKRSEKESLFVWETKELEPGQVTRAVSFTPDDRAILTFNRRQQTTWISLLESATGNERCRFTIPVDAHTQAKFAHGFSKNGELLAVGAEDGTTIVFDVRRCKQIARLAGCQGTICNIAFGSDLATLFTAGSDGTVLIWDLRAQLLAAQKAVEISPDNAKRYWTDLADKDTITAYRALGALLAARAQAVELLREKLKPVRRVPPADIEKLISDLDSNRTSTRQCASLELRRSGPQSTTALKKGLEKSRSLEQRRRIEALLAELKQNDLIPPRDELRELRAIEILEAIGTPAARSILERLAVGAPGSRITDEASFALSRLH